MQNLFEDLKKLLSQDNRFMVEGSLLKNKIVELALQVDAGLIKILLSNDNMKKHFFQEIDGILIFDKIKFQRFVSNKSFLPDSYTSYKNKIGLTVENDFISESKEVVLSWPYKDCFLEGGQTKEDVKRTEIFWNETLAPDQIDRLLSPKALVNFRKVNKDGQHSLKTISKKDNLLIKGNNLLALYSLKKIYSNEIKFIYIDPPYNTGNDSFQYNDNFNHSTWLTFMKNRLQVSRELLSIDGSIFISIDENEVGYLQILCDEIFGRENRANFISVKRGSVTGHKAINPGAVNVTEYILGYAKNKKAWKPNRVLRGRERNERYNTFINYRNESIDKWEFTSLLDAFAVHLGVQKNKLKKALGEKFEDEIWKFIKRNPEAVVQMAYPDVEKVSKEAREIIKRSEENPDQVFHIGR